MFQALHRFGAVLLFALLAAGSAQAADITYTVSGVHVDATAASAHAAEALAIEQGRPKAWHILFRRIAKQSDWDKEPKLDAAGVQKLSRGFSVQHERRSTTRYVADVTYLFSPEQVARLMRTLSADYALQPTGRRVLLIPMAPKFDPHSPWTEAFASPRFWGGTTVPFAVPTGSAPDVKALEQLDFDGAQWADVQQVAARIRASEAVLILAIPLNGRVQVWVRRIGAAEKPMKTSVDVPMQVKNVTQTYPLAADAAIRAMEEMWRQRPAVDFGAKATLTADVRIDSLEQWEQIQSAMARVTAVTGIQVLAMDIGLVRITLGYQGGADHLHDALAPVGVNLSQGPDGWTIAYGPPLQSKSASAEP